MKNSLFNGTFINWTRRGLALTSGVFLSLGLMIFVTFLASHQAAPENKKPLLVVSLVSQAKSISHEKQISTPLPETKIEESKPKKIQPMVKKPETPVERKRAIRKEEIAKTEMPTPIEKKMEENVEQEDAKEINKEPGEIVDEMVSNTPEVKEEITEVVPDQASPVNNENPVTDADTLPTPIPIFQLTTAPQFLHKASPSYPSAMLASGTTGIVKLEALIDKTGRVRKVSIIKSAGEHFDQSARQAILASSFYPAKVREKAVAVLLRLPVKYRLN